jgi:hypothetical protein
MTQRPIEKGAGTCEVRGLVHFSARRRILFTKPSPEDMDRSPSRRFSSAPVPFFMGQENKKPSQAGQGPAKVRGKDLVLTHLILRYLNKAATPTQRQFRIFYFLQKRA